MLSQWLSIFVQQPHHQRLPHGYVEDVTAVWYLFLNDAGWQIYLFCPTHQQHQRANTAMTLRDTCIIITIWLSKSRYIFNAPCDLSHQLLPLFADLRTPSTLVSSMAQKINCCLFFQSFVHEGCYCVLAMGFCIYQFFTYFFCNN